MILPQVLGVDGGSAEDHAHHGKQGGERLLEADDDGVLVRRFHLLRHRLPEHARARIVRQALLQRELDVLARHLLAVMELHALSEVENERFPSVFDLPGLRQFRLRTEIKIESDQLVVDVDGRHLDRGARFDDQVEVPRVGFQADNQRASPLLCPCEPLNLAEGKHHRENKENSDASKSDLIPFHCSYLQNDGLSRTLPYGSGFRAAMSYHPRH